VPGLLLLVALLQQQPPSPVTYDPPTRSTYGSTHECPDRQVRFEYESTGWTSGRASGVTVVRYRSGQTELAQDALAAWNSELARIRHFRTMELRCQTRDRALITALGTDEVGRDVQVVAAMQGPEIRFIRAPGGD